MFNFHEKVKKQTERATGDGVWVPMGTEFSGSYMISAISSTDFTR